MDRTWRRMSSLNDQIGPSGPLLRHFVPCDVVLIQASLRRAKAPTRSSPRWMRLGHTERLMSSAFAIRFLRGLAHRHEHGWISSNTVIKVSQSENEKLARPDMRRLDATRTPCIPLTHPDNAPALLDPQPPRQRAASPTGSADEAEAAEPEVEDEQGVHGQGDPVLHDAAPAQDTNAGCQRPGDEDEVDGDPGDLGDAQRGQERRDDEREERVPDDADALREGAVEVGVTSAEL